VSMIDLSALGPESVRPLRRAEYDRLVELGCFEDERIELLEGLLVAMSPPAAPHSFAINKLTMLFAQAIGTRAIVQVQNPLAVSDSSKPQPDLALLRDEDYSREHATWAFLVVEVSDSSLRKDRLVKAALYARARIPEYWIVNLDDRVLEVYRDPRDGIYARATSHRPGETLSPEAFGDIRVPVADVLPTLR
jgi:Uma2 family endonuclease